MLSSHQTEALADQRRHELLQTARSVHRDRRRDVALRHRFLRWRRARTR